jgi:bifunctional ADP-heptose synthase (sugar kinase/adenylyltransferase)
VIGDIMMDQFIWGTVSGYPLRPLSMAARARVREAASLANYAAGIVVGKVGTATAIREEMIKVIRESHHPF